MMFISLWEFTVLAFAAFRLTRLIVFDSITEFFRQIFLEEAEEEGEIYYVTRPGFIRGFIGELISCYWCTGVWAAALLYLSYLYFPMAAVPVIFVLAIAGAAALIESVIQRLI
jgi:hypothetical protein